MGRLAHGLKQPGNDDEIEVVDRYEGDAITDFGAPGAMPAADRRDVATRELDDLINMRYASWRAFDAAADADHAWEIEDRSG